MLRLQLKIHRRVAILEVDRRIVVAILEVDRRITVLEMDRRVVVVLEVDRRVVVVVLEVDRRVVVVVLEVDRRVDATGLHDVTAVTAMVDGEIRNVKEIKGFVLAHLLTPRSKRPNCSTIYEGLM
jgi:hypothetical protein